jgi:hypothetical protein
MTEQSVLWLVATLRAVWPERLYFASGAAHSWCGFGASRRDTRKRSENIRFSTAQRLPSLPKLYTLRGVSADSTNDVDPNLRIHKRRCTFQPGETGVVCRDEHTYRTIIIWLFFNQRG